ncbi:SWIM zinc finger family protein [Spirosoma fluminis]
MILTLDTFDQQLPKALLKKAQPYFQNGAVLYLEPDETGLWKAEVEGSDTYSVEITLDGRTITDSFCDCSVESATCKHVVATLFALRDELKKKAKQPKKKNVTGKSKKLTIADLLQQVSADELRAFLVQYAAADKTFATKLQLHFADKDERIDVGKHYTELVKKIIRAYSDRHGFVEYRATFKLAKEINKLLATGVTLIGQRNFKDALTLALVVVREIMTVLTQSDDSAGNMSGVFSEAVDLLRDIALSEDAAPALRRQLFDELAIELTNKRYFDYGDMGLWLLDVTCQTALRLSEPDLFLALIERLLPLQRSSISTFNQDYLRTMRVKFLREIGRTDEADRQMQASMDIVEVRAQAVDEAIRTEQYDQAKTLLLEGIRIAEGKKHPGTVSRWEKQLLAIAEAEKNLSETRRLTKRFAFDPRFDVAYFRRWKASFSADEWADEYRSLVERIRHEEAEEAKKRRTGWGYSLGDALLARLGPLLVEEKQWADLLALVQQAPRLDVLKQVLPYLAGPYPVEMLALFLPAIRSVAEQASTRPDYKNVASLLTLVRKHIAGSEESTNALINELKETFVKRPAMQEELRSIK